MADFAFQRQFTCGIAANADDGATMLESRRAVWGQDLEAQFHLPHPEQKPLFSQPEVAGALEGDFLDAQPHPVEAFVVLDVP